MIILATQWTPYNKTNEWFNVFKEVQGKIPSTITKWQSFASTDEDKGIKGYNLIMTKKENAEEALMDISKMLAPFWKIEGFAMKIEVLFSMRDAIKVLGKSL